MDSQARRKATSILALVGGLGGSILPGAARAHHPGSGTDAGWSWLWILAVVAATLIWPLLAFLERRQNPPSHRRERRKK